MQWYIPAKFESGFFQFISCFYIYAQLLHYEGKKLSAFFFFLDCADFKINRFELRRCEFTTTKDCLFSSNGDVACHSEFLLAGRTLDPGFKLEVTGPNPLRVKPFWRNMAEIYMIRFAGFFPAIFCHSQKRIRQRVNSKVSSLGSGN